jgi:HAD superfamily hydrolase (TIGR01509 family)
MLEALIWDVDGTIAETERDGHRLAFNQAFQAMGLHWHWDPARYGELLHITGGRERLLHDMDNHDDAPADPAERVALAAVLHRRKNEAYADIVGMARIVPRPGVLRLMEEARAAGLRQAIATTTSRTNVDALLGGWFGRQWPERFVAVVCGEDVTNKKPDPEVYQRTLAQLACRADEAIAIEDSLPGLTSAGRAGLAVLLTPSVYFPRTQAMVDADVTANACVLAVCDSLDQPPVMDVARLRALLDQLTLRRSDTSR